MMALRKNRVNHAYLFSGPRGCGKTTSARILARCLNCAQGPTDTPCGTCPSCVELARGGSGSLDVIEIDAASHGGVDDARDLRERATFAPVRDRYKIFIIDEAHMVTSAGFNALLKIVEEPPEHIKFIFATTEPDKVIGTIRSRTHHYPFRLVPPEPLLNYLEQLCASENVPVAPGVLSLVIRAGGGSVRDTLSVLDQLMAGAGPNGLDYELAVALLGYTHASLLDDVVEAVAAADSATVFRAVDRVIQTGHDPRRFVEDLLERFRDLIIVQAMPESANAILRGVPADQIARMRTQAKSLGASELSRAADVTNTALTEMTGATSPRLHLELLCARILLPGSDETERGIAARIDRVERRLNYGGTTGATPADGQIPTSGQPQPVPESVPVHPTPATAAGSEPLSGPDAARAAIATARSTTPETTGAHPEQGTAALPAGASVTPAPGAAVSGAESAAGRSHAMAEAQHGTAQREPITAPRVSTNDWPVEDRAQGPAAPKPLPPAQAPQPQATPPKQPQRPTPQPSAASPSGGDVEVLRRAWPEILQTLAKIKRSTWALVEPNAQVAQFDGQQLTLSFTTPGLAGAFGRADHSENLRQAIHKTIGIDCQITAVAGGVASSEPNPKAPTSRAVPAASVDEAWGLATAPTADTKPAPAANPASASTPTHRETVQSRAQAPNGSISDGSYANADDDWGPPRDEDAPPLEEEPPADWEPSQSTGRRPQAPQASQGPQAPQAQGPQAPYAQQPQGPQQPDAPIEDPWSRAVEHAPGTWVVGTESNVGRGAEPVHGAAQQEAPAQHEATTQNETPSQNEATTQNETPAQQQAPALQQPPAEPSSDGWGAAPQPAGSVAAPNSATRPAATAVVDRAQPSAAPKQSLYQRLTSSPEALAGRTQAPAVRPAAPASYVEDIPSADDETIEESRVFGRAAVERILGGKLLEERSLDGSPLPRR